MNLFMRRDAHQNGSTLLIVVGLSAILLVMAMAFLTSLRQESVVSARIIRDQQARMMLTGALQYLMETSRIGWGDGVETFGWTDLRDGSPGPRGRRVPTSAGSAQYALPSPVWEAPSPRNATYDDLDADPANAYTARPSYSSTIWPCPGTAMRGDCYAMIRPPGAIRPMAFS